MNRSSPPPFRLILLVVIALLAGAGCGGSEGDDDTPDEASFCRLAEQFAPVADAPLRVLERLDELAPDEIDDAVAQLRDATEELERHGARSAERVKAEFELRFQPDFIATRRQVEAYIAATCPQPKAPGTTTTAVGSDAPGASDHDGDDRGGDETDQTGEEPDGTEN